MVITFASKIKKAVFNLIFIVLLFFMALAAAELSVRIFLWVSGKGGYVWLPDYYLGVIHAPSSSFIHKEDFSAEFTVKRRTNSLGLIGNELCVKKSKDIFRIIILGDSFTEGLQVREGKNFCELLQVLLNSSGIFPSRRFEVINAGVSGYSPISEYLILKRDLIGLEPDMVIQQLFANDIFDDNKIGAMSLLNRDGMPLKINRFFLKKYSNAGAFISGRDEFFYRINRSFLNKSILFQIISRAVTRSYKKSALNAKKIMLPEFNNDNQFFIIQSDNVLFQDTSFREKALANTEKYILAIKGLAEGWGCRFMLFYIPPERQLKLERYGQNSNYFTRDPNYFLNERLSDFSRKEKIFYLDLLDCFEKNKSMGLYYDKDGHLTEAGNSIAAGALFEAIKDNLSGWYVKEQN